MREIYRANGFPAMRESPRAASTHFWGNNRQAHWLFEGPWSHGGRNNSQNSFFSQKDSFFTVSLPWKGSVLKKSNTPKLEILLIDNKTISRAKPATAQRGSGARLPSHCPLWAQCVSPWALSQGTVPRTALLNQKLGAFGTEKKYAYIFCQKMLFLMLTKGPD